MLAQSLQVGIVVPCIQPPRRDSSTIRFNGKKFCDDALSVSGTDGLRVELDCVNGKGWMAQSHDESGRRFGGVDQQPMGAIFDGDEGLVSREFQSLTLLDEDAGTVVVNLNRYPVNRSKGRGNDVPSVSGGQCLDQGRRRGLAGPTDRPAQDAPEPWSGRRPEDDPDRGPE